MKMFRRWSALLIIMCLFGSLLLLVPQSIAYADTIQYDDPDANWNYSGAWTAATLSGPYNGTYHYTNDLSATASFTFNGRGFVYGYVTHVSRGEIQVWVDGNLITTINANGTLNWQARYTSPFFASGTHTVIFKNASSSTGYYIDVDVLFILTTTTYDDQTATAANQQTATAAYKLTATANASTSTAAYNQTATSNAATATAAYNQTATSNAATATAANQQTATAAYEQTQIASQNQATQTAAFFQTSTASALTATAQYFTDLTATSSALTATALGFTSTSTASPTVTLTATITLTPTNSGPTHTPAPMPTMYWDSRVTYGEFATTTALLLLAVLLTVAFVSWMIVSVLDKKGKA